MPKNGITVAVSPKAARWAAKISAEWDSARDAFFAAGRLLNAAKADCEHGEWTALVGELPFGIRTAQMLMTIASSERLSNTKTFSLLPNSFVACYELEKLTDDEFEALWDAGIVQPDAKLSEVRAHIAKIRREEKHRSIRDSAVNAHIEDGIGPFPIIYADPPWQFETYSWQGARNSPEKHYPTMTDEEICEYEVDGVWIGDRAHRDAVLFLWAPSNLFLRAAAVMSAWGFTYRTHFVWDKMRNGTGYYMMNSHECLLIGKHGHIPIPEWVPPYSIFPFSRGEHSVKPPEIRGVIERMYPAYDERTRIELFCRQAAPGWTVDGYEAHGS